MEFKGLFVNSMLVVAIALCMVLFITAIQSNYNVANPLVNNSKAAYLVGLRNNVSNLYENANNSQTGLYSQTPSTDSGGLMLTTIVSSGKILSASISFVYDVIVKQSAASLGIDPLIVAIFEAMMIGGVILLAWSLYRLGR